MTEPPGTWAAFALEYGIRLYLAPAKGRFVRSNVIDLVVVIVPFLRPLRVARSAGMIRSCEPPASACSSSGDRRHP